MTSSISGNPSVNNASALPTHFSRIHGLHSTVSLLDGYHETFAKICYLDPRSIPASDLSKTVLNNINSLREIRVQVSEVISDIETVLESDRLLPLIQSEKEQFIDLQKNVCRFRGDIDSTMGASHWQITLQPTSWSGFVQTQLAAADHFVDAADAYRQIGDQTSSVKNAVDALLSLNTVLEVLQAHDRSSIVFEHEIVVEDVSSLSSLKGSSDRESMGSASATVADLHKRVESIITEYLALDENVDALPAELKEYLISPHPRYDYSADQLSVNERDVVETHTYGNTVLDLVLSVIDYLYVDPETRSSDRLTPEQLTSAIQLFNRLSPLMDLPIPDQFSAETGTLIADRSFDREIQEKLGDELQSLVVDKLHSILPPASPERSNDSVELGKRLGDGELRHVLDRKRAKVVSQR